MRITLLMFAIMFTAASIFGQTTSSYVRAGADNRSWTIGNALVEREIRFDPNEGLYTASWRHKLTGTDFMVRAASHRGPEFSFHANQEQLVGAGTPAWALEGAEISDTSPAGKKFAVKLRQKNGGIGVEVFYAVYNGHPVVRKWLAITNRGGEAITLSHLAFESVMALPGAPADLQVSGFYGAMPREVFFTGRVEDAAIVERNSRTGEGMVVMNEAPGYSKRTEMTGWGEGIQSMYDTDLFPFERRIEPGEAFTTAKCSVAFFVDGRDFADRHWVVPSYTSQVLLKKGASYQPPWIYNTWEPFTRGINADISSGLMTAAARMGLDVFTIDDGWQLDYGDNTVNTAAFPKGLEDVVASVERSNMRLGLWVPLAAISPNTAVYKEHPEWLCKDLNGPKSTGTAAGSQAVMCLATPYKEVAAKRISELIGRYHLKYVKIDLTTVFNAYGESPGCYASGHEHKTWAESLERIYEGIQYVTDHIYQDHPDVLLDLTYELWGQKHIIDYGLLAAGDLDWLSNVDDNGPEAAGPRQARTLLYHRSLAIPTETMLIGNLQANRSPVEERFATAIGSGPLFLGDLRKLSPGELNWYGEKIRWFKNLRREVPLNEGFFPLGFWQQPGAGTWDGFARLSREGEGIIVIFNNQAGSSHVDLKLPAFPDGHFRLRSIIGGTDLGMTWGRRIRAELRVDFPPAHNVEILEIRKLGQ